MYQYIREFPVTIALALATLLVFLIPNAETVCELQTGSALLSQWFQVLACHLAHWSADHLMWDLMMFVLMGVICEKQNRGLYAIVLVASGVLIPFLVTQLAPNIDSYRGLSGVDTALFGMAMWYLIGNSVEDRNWWGTGFFSLLFLGMFAKIGVEYLSGSTLFAEGDNFTAVPSAHLVGALIGCAAGLYEILGHSNLGGLGLRLMARSPRATLEESGEALR